MVKLYLFLCRMDAGTVTVGRPTQSGLEKTESFETFVVVHVKEINISIRDLFCCNYGEA